MKITNHKKNARLDVMCPSQLTQAKMEKIYRRLVESGARVQDTDAPMGLMQQNPEAGDLEPLDPESEMGRLLRKS